jgi:hypothetical protein
MIRLRRFIIRLLNGYSIRRAWFFFAQKLARPLGSAMNGLTYSRLRDIEKREARRERIVTLSMPVWCLLIYAALLALAFGS